MVDESSRTGAALIIGHVAHAQMQEHAQHVHVHAKTALEKVGLPHEALEVHHVMIGGAGMLCIVMLLFIMAICRFLRPRERSRAARAPLPAFDVRREGPELVRALSPKGS